MPSLASVYEKFGEVAEAAQLLETQVGNALLAFAVTEHGLVERRNLALARKVFTEIDRKTLGQLISNFKVKSTIPVDLEQLLASALQERNRLNHAFYREHNFRRNSEEGRTTMLEDLEVMHERIIAAYVALLRADGFDLEQERAAALPMKHLPLAVKRGSDV